MSWLFAIDTFLSFLTKVLRFLRVISISHGGDGRSDRLRIRFGSFMARIDTFSSQIHISMPILSKKRDYVVSWLLSQIATSI